MFGLGWPEIFVCGLVGFFVFGPERLPHVIRDATQTIRRLRAMADDMGNDLRTQMPDLPTAADLGLDDLRDLRDLHPKRLVGRALFDDEDRGAPRVDYGAGGGGGGAAPAKAPSMTREQLPVGAIPPYDLDAT